MYHPGMCNRICFSDVTLHHHGPQWPMVSKMKTVVMTAFNNSDDLNITPSL